MEKNHTPAERPIFQRIEDGLKQAVEQNPDLEWPEEGSRTRRQKYTVQAVEYFTRGEEDPVLTASWYKYGKTYPAAPSWPSSTSDPFQAAVLTQSEIHSTSQDEIAHFFTHRARRPKLDAKHWYMGTTEFLDAFYNYHAPSEYQDLYLANLELRRVFAETKTEIDSLRGSHNNPASSFSDFGNSQTADYYRRIGKVAARIQVELATNTELEEALVPVREFTDLVEDTFMMLARLPEEELTADHRKIIGVLEDFYSETVWEYPAVLLMLETAEGPNSSLVRSKAEAKLETLRDSYSSKLEQKRQLCADAGLRPRISDYPDDTEEVGSSINGLMRTLDGTDER